MVLMQARTRAQRFKCALHALRHKVRHPRVSRVAVFPTVSDNPYFQMFYSAWAAPVYAMDPATALKLRRLGLVDVLHLHWDEFIFPPDNPSVSAQNRESIKGFKAAGGRIVWTMHNARPHRLEQQELLDRFDNNRQILLELCDAVHVHSQAAADLLGQGGNIESNKINIVPHPSYIASYDIPPAKTFSEKKRFLIFGIMHAAKGIDFICSGFDAVKMPEQIQAVHFGGRGAEGFVDRFGNKIPVDVSRGGVPDADVPKVFGAADFCVFGFKSTLTSGSLLLAISMGTPPIFPDFPSLSEGMPECMRRLSYPPGDLAGLQVAIEYALTMDAQEYRRVCAACQEMSNRLAPHVLSPKLEGLVLGR